MFKNKVLLLVFSYLFLILALFLYSFTQTDLGLTIIKIKSLHAIENAFQYVGYFERPLSTALYIGIILLLFIFYGLFLILAYKRLLSRKLIWLTVIITTVILAFSYNAFSYDLFNYIFDAKIVTFYQQNPYQHKALDYTSDPMLGFMHWTQRTYPYGPMWLVLTVPLSFLGFHIFLLTFFLFKLLMAGSFLGTVYFIGKIQKKLAANQELFSLVFFALNPLVLIESLVSAHNDIVMLFFAVFAVYLLLTKKYITFWLLLLVSFAIKFATGLLLPVFLYIHYSEKQNKQLSWDKLFLVIVLFMTLATIIASVRTNFQPWYLLYVLPFAALISKKQYVLIPGIILPFFALLIYVPFLFLGNWNNPVPQILIDIELTGIVVSALVVGVMKVVKRRQATA